MGLLAKHIYNLMNQSFVAIFLVVLTTSVFAQSGPHMAEYEAIAPKIGEPLPDITIFDDLGNPVNLRDLPGENYKVLVLGCLT